MSNDVIANDSSTLKLLEGVQVLRQAVNRNDWNEVEAISDRCIGNAYAKLRSLQRSRLLSEDVNDRAKGGPRSTRSAMAGIVKSLDREEFLKTLRQRHPDDPDRLERLERVFDSLASDDKGDEALDRFEELDHQDINRTNSNILTCMSRALLGLVHAAYNKQWQRLARLRRESGLTHFQSLDFGAAVNDFDRDLHKAQARVHADMVSSESGKPLIASLEALTSLVERKLPAFAGAQATANHQMRALLRLGKGTATRDLGRLSARAGLLTRKAIACHGASLRLLLEAGSPDTPDDIKRFLRRAKTTAFSRPLPDGRNTALKDLENAADGDLIDIEGIVVGMRVLRLGEGKLVSQIRIADPANRSSAIAVSIFTHLPHIGLTLGAYCRLTGIYKTSSVVFKDGGPAVEIDRLSVKELARENWLMGFYDLASDAYFPWRNGTQIEFSLGRHQRAQSVDTPSHHGAGELIYPSFSAN